MTNSLHIIVIFSSFIYNACFICLILQYGHPDGGPISSSCYHFKLIFNIRVQQDYTFTSAFECNLHNQMKCIYKYIGPLAQWDERGFLKQQTGV